LWYRSINPSQLAGCCVYIIYIYAQLSLISVVLQKGLSVDPPKELIDCVAIILKIHPFNMFICRLSVFRQKTMGKEHSIEGRVESSQDKTKSVTSKQ